MPDTSDELALYLHLARASELRRRPLVRDKLLVLAGKAAVELRLFAVAEHCRGKVLAHNPGHILRNYPNMAAALEDDAFRLFFKRLAQAYPRERAEHMLRLLGIELAGERHVYADDLEYAAALLGTTPERLGRCEPAASTKGIPGTSPTAPAAITLPAADRRGALWRRSVRWIEALLLLAVTLLVVTIVAMVVHAAS